MKKVFFKSMVGVVFVGMAMSSCVEIEDLYDPEYAAKLAEYRAQWVEKFGEIDPNEDWGFSSDASEAKAMTRGSDPRANMWSTFVNVPSTVTPDEVETVKEVFSKPVNPELVRQLNFSDFFIQHVYGAKHSYQTEQKDDGSVETLENVKLEEMATAFKNADGTYTYDHVNNFNASDGGIMLMVASSTECFAYKNPNDGGTYYPDYVIMEVNGEYYVGFDYSLNVTNKEVKADGIYDDWIVKVVPAEYIDTKRVICEDLGTIGDFDFNDVIFDVYNDNGTAVITVRAAGGTLPVTIGGVDVHKAFCVADDVMVNTNAIGGASCPPAIFRIPMPSSGNLCDIEVVVKTTDAVCILKAPKGDAPQKICVTTGFVWPDERVSIKDMYPNFPKENWAGDCTDEEEVVVPEVVVPEGSIDITQYAGDQGDLYEAQRIPAELFGTNGAVITIETTGKVGSLYACYSSSWTSVASMYNNSSIVDAGTYTFEITAEECAGIKKAGWLYITFNGNSNVVTKMTLTNM